MKKYYRYKEVAYGYASEDDFYYPNNYNLKIECVEYDVLSKTPKGCWIGRWDRKEHWISDTSKKKYAYPTKDEAMKAFKIRKKRQKEILENQLTKVKWVLNLLEAEEKSI